MLFLLNGVSIILNPDEQYISRYIILEGLPVRYKSTMLGYILDKSSDISLSDMKIACPLQFWYPIFRNLGVRLDRSEPKA